MIKKIKLKNFKGLKENEEFILDFEKNKDILIMDLYYSDFNVNQIYLERLLKNVFNFLKFRLYQPKYFNNQDIFNLTIDDKVFGIITLEYIINNVDLIHKITLDKETNSIPFEDIYTSEGELILKRGMKSEQNNCTLIEGDKLKEIVGSNYLSYKFLFSKIGINDFYLTDLYPITESLMFANINIDQYLNIVDSFEIENQYPESLIDKVTFLQLKENLKDKSFELMNKFFEVAFPEDKISINKNYSINSVFGNNLFNCSLFGSGFNYLYRYLPLFIECILIDSNFYSTDSFGKGTLHPILSRALINYLQQIKKDVNSKSRFLFFNNNLDLKQNVEYINLDNIL